MKLKILSTVLVFVFMISLLGGCTVMKFETPIIAPDGADVVTPKWVCAQIEFTAQAQYDKTDILSEVSADVIFTAPSGKEYTVPMFWNGGSSWLVRFAPTECGIWTYRSVCSNTADAGLDGICGTLGCNEYTGPLDIYRHGFVKTEEGKKYFVYDDGTPFFYLGDTHWGMYDEELDEKGDFAGNIGTSSHFRYIVATRALQGFTVYQSEPIDAPFNLEDGFDESDIDGFKKADRYYDYIAEKGLVHANAEFFFTPAMAYSIFKNDSANLTDGAAYKYLENISRYWVARFGAYPVMWTMAQECDNDFYYERGDQTVFSSENNPWVKVCEYISKYDCYSHPITAHQESTDFTTVKNSAFKNAEGHSFWGAQWSPSLVQPETFDVPREYYESEKPAINYEGRYCGLWTKDFGARAQGWTAYLNGMFGYGYGAIDMWLYNSSYNTDSDTFDGVETVTAAEKQQVKWSESLFFDSAYQLGVMKNFLSSLEWWRLEPEFNNSEYYRVRNARLCYACAHIENSVFVVYFYSNPEGSMGKLKKLEAGKTYTAQWFDPQTGKTETVCDSVVPTEENGEFVYEIPERTGGRDAVFVLTQN